MASFTIGDYRFDVISHSLIRGGANRFVVDAFYQGAPLNWHPNQTGADDYSGIPNRANYEFYGVDFRAKFWVNLALMASKARLAARLAKTLAAVTDAEIDQASNPDRALTRGAFTEPTNLRTRTKDAAIAVITG